MEQKLFNFINTSLNAIFICNIISNNVIFMNNKAKEFNNDMLENFDFKNVIEITGFNFDEILKTLSSKDEKFALHKFNTIKINDENVIFDIIIQYFNDEKTEIIIEFLPINDFKLEALINQVNETFRPKAIIDFDKKLTILHCNKPFRKAFEADENTCICCYYNSLINVFPLEIRNDLKHEILSNLKNSNAYTTKVKVCTSVGEEHWYLLDLQRIKIDDSGNDKLIVHMLNIEKQVEIEEKYSKFKQYFNYLQELTSDILYQIDIKDKSLYHSVDGYLFEKFGNPVKNCYDVFLNEEIVYIDDQEHYKNCLKRFYSKDVQVLGLEDECVVRLRIITENYEWYSIKWKKIYNDGELVNIIGAIVNVESEKKIKNEFNYINQYFQALQSITSDSFYTVNIKQKVLKQSKEIAEQLGISEEIHNFPNSIFDKIHIDDLENFKDFIDTSTMGLADKTQIRMLSKNGNYQWYEMFSEIIYDENCTVAEFIGKITNIQKQRDLELRANSDPMTKVLNKFSFDEEVNKIIYNSNALQRHALILIDIDDFNYINVNFGHSFGDFLITTITMRLNKLVRETDLLARIGGDKFSLFLKDVGDDKSIMERADIFLENLNKEFAFEGRSTCIKACFGISTFNKHGTNYKTLYNKSDIALSESKSKGQNIISIYTS